MVCLSSTVKLCARALPPAFPLRTFPEGVFRSSSISLNDSLSKSFNFDDSYIAHFLRQTKNPYIKFFADRRKFEPHEFPINHDIKSYGAANRTPSREWGGSRKQSCPAKCASPQTFANTAQTFDLSSVFPKNSGPIRTRPTFDDEPRPSVPCSGSAGSLGHGSQRGRLVECFGRNRPAYRSKTRSTSISAGE